MNINEEVVKDIINSTNEEEYLKAQVKFANEISDRIVAEAQSMIDESMDNVIRANAGVRGLTAEETAFYNEVLSQGGFKGIEKMMPETIVDRIFEDLEKNHPILNEIQFTNTTGITKFYVRKTDAEGAEWGKLSTEIQKKIDSTFDIIDVTQKKLTAYVPVSHDMRVLGPNWVDKYVRAILSEAIAKSLEDKIINGNGVDCPTGMLMDTSKPFSDSTGYPERAAVSISDLSPKTLGEKLMKPLVEGRKDTAPNIILVVNPADYWSKIFPETTVMSAAGQYVFNVLPVNAKVVQSSAMPAGKMVGCIPKDYFLGVGMNTIVQYSDEYRFLEDERIYMTKMLANGRPMNEKSFITFDISGLKGEAPKVLKSGK